MKQEFWIFSIGFFLCLTMTDTVKAGEASPLQISCGKDCRIIKVEVTDDEIGAYDLIIEKNNKVITRLQEAMYTTENAIEVFPEVIFWSGRVRIDNSSTLPDNFFRTSLLKIQNWFSSKSEIKKEINRSKNWVRFRRDIKTGQDQKIDVPYSGTLSCPTKVAFSSNQSVFVLDLAQRKSTMVYPRKGQPDTVDDGYTLLAWSKDCEKLWFGVGVVDGWSQLVLFENGHIHIFKNVSGYNDEKVNPENGWLTISTAPLGNGESGSIEKLQKEKTLATLSILNVYTGEKIPVAQTFGQYFGERWSEDGDLEYNLNTQSIKLTQDMIKKSFKEHQ